MNTDIKLYLSAIFLTLFSFSVLGLISPMSGDSIILSEYYDLVIKNVYKHNKYSSFKLDSEGNHSIHPGQIKNVIGEFTFKRPVKLSFDFSILKTGDMCLKNTKQSDIWVYFETKINGDTLNSFTVMGRETYSLNYEFSDNDQLEIITFYSYNLPASCQLVNLSIEIEDNTKLFIHYLLTPLIWAVFLIYFSGKNHTVTAINSFLIFATLLIAEKLNFGALSLASILTYTSFILSFLFLFIIIFQEIKVTKLKLGFLFSFLISIILYSIPLFYIIYSLNFETNVTKETLYAVFQTNINETIDYIFVFINVKWLAFILVAVTILGFFILKQEKKESEKIERSLSVVLTILFLAFAYVHSSDMRILSLVSNSFEKYKFELDKFKQIQNKRKNSLIQYQGIKKNKNETFIVILGESLNKANMGLYGYVRNTTPLLSKLKENNEIIVFDNAYSNHTHTMPVMEMALTESNQLNKKKYYESPSIIDLARSAGFKTYWVTNQFLLGDYDNIVSVIAHGAGKLYSLNKNIGLNTKSSKNDFETITVIKNILKHDFNKNRVIYVHLMGSHWDYCERFSSDYNKYQSDLTAGLFGKTAQSKKLEKYLNCYDNSVLYNDFVVTSILDELRATEGVSGLVYFADHADDVFRLKGHDSGMFTYSMVNIPLIMWFSDDYKSTYRKKYQNLVKNKNKIFPNDLVYDSLLGIFDISTKRYNQSYDISSDLYKLDDNQLYTLHGKRLFTSKENYSYTQKSNIGKLVSNEQLSRVIPNRVNTIGKLKQILYDGYRSFELDLVFTDQDGSYFETGHDSTTMSGNKLQHLLAKLPLKEVERIRFDINNLNSGNIKKVLSRLLELDVIYSLKNRVIIESTIKNDSFMEFSKAGFHTSYYLPTEKIDNLIKGKNVVAMTRLAVDIAKQSKEQQLSAVSFDYNLYPFVKQYLEPVLSNKIVFHIRDLDNELKNKEFSKKLNSRSYFKNSRIQTISVPYHSPFHL